MIEKVSLLYTSAGAHVSEQLCHETHYQRIFRSDWGSVTSCQIIQNHRAVPSLQVGSATKTNPILPHTTPGDEDQFDDVNGLEVSNFAPSRHIPAMAPGR